MARKKKRLTKRERKERSSGPSGARPVQPVQHIHCIACGRHVDPGELTGAFASASILTCDHGGRFPACIGCADAARTLIAEHDRTGKAVQAVQAWH